MTYCISFNDQFVSVLSEFSPIMQNQNKFFSLQNDKWQKVKDLKTHLMNRLNDMTFSRDQNPSDNSTSSWYVVNVSDLTMLCRKLNWKLLLARPNKTKTRNSNSHDDFHLVHHNFHACWYFYHPEFGRSLWVRENTAVNMRQSQSKLRFSILLLMLLLCRIYCNRMCVRQNAIRMFTKIYRNPLNGCVRQHAKETTRGVRFHLVCLRARNRKKVEQNRDLITIESFVWLARETRGIVWETQITFYLDFQPMNAWLRHMRTTATR